jgi:hypothetical protein
MSEIITDHFFHLVYLSEQFKPKIRVYPLHPLNPRAIEQAERGH